MHQTERTAPTGDGSDRTIYEEVYRQQDYYWGFAPSSLCYQVMQVLPPVRPLRLLDLGCGEGKDAVFFARNGYDVTAVDVTASGLEKARRLAEGCGVALRTVRADLEEFRLDETYDVLYSSGALHYIRPALRDEVFANWQAHTAPGGVHALNCFVEKPFIAPPPENEPRSFFYRSGELFGYYTDWLLHTCTERIFDCDSSGVPHQHCMDTVVAQRMV